MAKIAVFIFFILLAFFAVSNAAADGTDCANVMEGDDGDQCWPLWPIGFGDKDDDKDDKGDKDKGGKGKDDGGGGDKNSALRMETCDSVWQVHLCDDVTHLLNTFFQRFRTDYCENSTKLFASDWSTKNLGSYLGLPDYFFVKNYSYLLAKYEKCHAVVTLQDYCSVPLEPAFAQEINRLKVEDERAVAEFLAKYGSHFVSSYAFGDAIYQIFVYSRATMDHFKKLKKSHANRYVEELVNYGVTSAVRAGEIRSLSGDKRLEERLNFELQDGARPKYSNIFYAMNDTKILAKQGHQLKGNVPLHFDLTSVAKIMPNESKAAWMDDFLNNHFKLRELYL